MQSLAVFSLSQAIASMYLPSTFVMATWYFLWLGSHKSIKRPYYKNTPHITANEVHARNASIIFHDTYDAREEALEVVDEFRFALST